MNVAPDERLQKDSLVQTIACSEAQLEELRMIAHSTTAGIWRIKRAKIILGSLKGNSVDRLVQEVRVPPMSVVKCQQRFAREGMAYFSEPDRRPTTREANVENILTFLDSPPDLSHNGWDSLTHRYIGIHFSARAIKTIRDLIAKNPESTRPELAREVCLRFNLFQPNGKIRATIVGDILQRMDMDNLIALPPISQTVRQVRAPNSKLSVVAPHEVKLNPLDFEELRIIPVNARHDVALWNAIIHEHHYIRTYRMFGPQLRYLVYGGRRTNPQTLSGDSSEAKACTETNHRRSQMLLGALGFAASAWRISSRDAFIGWSDEQRVVNLRYVVSNARFLILPWVRCPNLASRILGAVARRLPQDWEDRYHYRPVLLETFVQLDRFTGTCYKAANWIRLGTTEGYSLYSRQKKLVPRKAIFVYPLTRNFRTILCGLT